VLFTTSPGEKTVEFLFRITSPAQPLSSVRFGKHPNPGCSTSAFNSYISLFTEIFRRLNVIRNNLDLDDHSVDYIDQDQVLLYFKPRLWSEQTLDLYSKYQ
jgi:hypothetical protein